MPQKKKKRPKNTPTHRVGSSGANVELTVNDVVSIFQERFTEIASKVAWRKEQVNDLPASQAGPLLNESIVSALTEVRPLYPEFVQQLRALGFTDDVVKHEAQQAWARFRKICSRFISSYTLKKLERNALAQSVACADTKMPNFPRDNFGKRIGELMLKFPRKTNREILGMIDSEYHSDERNTEIPKRFKKHGHCTPGNVMVGTYDCPKEHCAHNMESYLSRIRKRIKLGATAISRRPPKPQKA